MTPNRQSLLARVHIARKEMGLDEETYRAVLMRLTGKDSARFCSDAELLAVINDFKARGWSARGVPAPSTPRRGVKDSTAGRHGAVPRNFAGSDRSPQLRKIGALLADAGRPWEYARGIAAHMFHGKRLEFCTPKELAAIIAALSKDAQRRAGKENKIGGI